MQSPARAAGMLRPMAKTTDVLLDGLAFPEGPRWRDGKLWFSDMHDQRVKTVDLDGRCEEVVRVENDPSGLGWLPDGRLLVVSMRDRRSCASTRDGLREVADLSRVATYHCNDMVTDARGPLVRRQLRFRLSRSASRRAPRRSRSSRPTARCASPPTTSRSRTAP